MSNETNVTDSAVDDGASWPDDQELLRAYATKRWLPDDLTLTKITLAMPATMSLFAGEAPRTADVAGYVSDDIPGLGVHHDSGRYGWAITHLESGHRLPGSTPYSLVTALVIAGLCARLTDWRSVHLVDGHLEHDELDDESFKALRETCKSGITALVETYDGFNDNLDDRLDVVVELLDTCGHPMEVA